jgi:hypothetical protein
MGQLIEAKYHHHFLQQHNMGDYTRFEGAKTLARMTTSIIKFSRMTQSRITFSKIIIKKTSFVRMTLRKLNLAE